jgi:hypothetical protein
VIIVVTFFQKDCHIWKQSIRAIGSIRMRQDDFGIISTTFLRMVTGNANVGEFQQPRDWKSHTKVDVGRKIAPFWLIGAQHVRQDLKIHFTKYTIAVLDNHLMSIFARRSQGNVAL